MPSLLRMLIVLLLDTVALFLLRGGDPRLRHPDVGRGARDGGGPRRSQRARVAGLARFTLPLSMLTLGLSALVLNGALVVIAALVSPSVEISGWLAARSSCSG